MEKPGASAGGGRFVTTRWSVILAAGDKGSPRSSAALAELCGTYWYPLYAFARRKGLSAEAAQDATQGFFAHVLEKNALRNVGPDKGRFRSYLLVAFKNHMTDERLHAARVKRGGEVTHVPIDIETAEGRYSHEPADVDTPERIFERRWALTVLDRALERLRGEYEKGGREKVFESLKGYLTGESGSVPYASAATKLGMTEIAIKVAVHRLRRRFRARLLEEVAETVGGEEHLEREIRHLMSALESP
jgi:RNA polymerase sigma-70 factor (ECF subfamily)